MSKDKKLYQVFKKFTQKYDDGYSTVLNIPLGYTYANSINKAISNVKYDRGIKTKNHYTKDNYTTNCLEIYDFVAYEVKKEDK